MAAANILFVDDEQIAIQSLIVELEERGFSVFHTRNKHDVLDLYESRGIDITLVALTVSGFSGFEVLSMLKSFDPDAKIVLYTDYGSKENIVKALRLGASEFVEKPLEIETILPILKRLMEEEKKKAGLQGNLKTMNLASIIQINCEDRNQAQLLLYNRGQEGRIYFDQGRVVHAEVNDLMGEEAVYELLRWDQGTFSLEMGMAAPLRTVDSGWSQMVLEGMRRIDENQVDQALDWQETTFEEEEKSHDESGVVQRITKAISRIENVQGVVICDLDGDVLASNFAGDDWRMANVSHFLIRQAEELGSITRGGPIHKIFLRSGENKGLVLPFQDMIIYILLSKRAVPDALAEEARMMIRRYQP